MFGLYRINIDDETRAALLQAGFVIEVGNDVRDDFESQQEFDDPEMPRMRRQSLKGTGVFTIRKGLLPPGT